MPRGHQGAAERVTPKRGRRDAGMLYIYTVDGLYIRTLGTASHLPLLPHPQISKLGTQDFLKEGFDYKVPSSGCPEIPNLEIWGTGE